MYTLTDQSSNTPAFTACPNEVLAAEPATWTNSSPIHENTQSPSSHQPFSPPQLQSVTATLPDLFHGFDKELLRDKRSELRPMPYTIAPEAWLLKLLGEQMGKLGRCNDPALQLPDNEPQPAPKPKPIRNPYEYCYCLDMGTLAMVSLPVFHPDNDPNPQPPPIRDPQGYQSFFDTSILHRGLST